MLGVHDSTNLFIIQVGTSGQQRWANTLNYHTEDAVASVDFDWRVHIAVHTTMVEGNVTHGKCSECIDSSVTETPVNNLQNTHVFLCLSVHSAKVLIVARIPLRPVSTALKQLLGGDKSST